VVWHVPGYRSWATGQEDVQALHAAQQALAGDVNWAQFVDKETAGFHVEEPALTTQTLFHRLA
jgi:hypothetical protein